MLSSQSYSCKEKIVYTIQCIQDGISKKSQSTRCNVSMALLPIVDFIIINTINVIYIFYLLFNMDIKFSSGNCRSSLVKLSLLLDF